MSVEDYIQDWLDKLQAYLSVEPTDFRDQVTASLHDRYRQILLLAGAEILE